MATGHVAPDPLSQGRPCLVIFSFFIKLLSFLHQQQIVQQMEDRREQNFQRSALYQYFLLFILYFRIFSTCIKMRINSYFLHSVLEKISYIEKRKKQIQCCRWLLLIGEWRYIVSYVPFSFPSKLYIEDGLNF